ncbi:unnamed protein product [Prunus armeniaca]|uniref:Uncharacterized protein n=1 Tax=Prunus armeniaca TaxID=36596 RepID=A0A6J5UQ71_PRUAR|nr:unnamed protein product [Prunus armeniaca]
MNFHFNFKSSSSPFLNGWLICTVGINKWLELQRKSILQQQQQLPENAANALD